MIDRGAITGVILCGGDARRMSGVDKPLQLLDDRPLVAHVQARLTPQVARVLISANRMRDSYAAYGDEVVRDSAPGAGPLGGLSSTLDALQSRQTPYLFACPGDAPFLDPLLVVRLAAALADTDADVAVPHDGTRAQHLFLLMRTTLQPDLALYLDTGARSVHGWLDTQRVCAVDAADIAASFANINTMQELQDARDHIDRPRHHHLRQDQEPL
jgi:molybdopterin-guanine dinucleotide biosynthesis protein A